MRRGWVFGILCTAALSWPVAAFAHGGNTALVHSCVKSSGAVRIVGARSKCHRGERALDWPKSARGARGAPGLSGPPGARGPTGLAGPTGAPGAPGAAGSPGAKGDRGPTGTGGSNSSTGASGPRGATGPPGAAGPTGAPRANGSEGRTGARVHRPHRHRLLGRPGDLDPAGLVHRLPDRIPARRSTSRAEPTRSPTSATRAPTARASRFSSMPAAIPDENSEICSQLLVPPDYVSGASFLVRASKSSSTGAAELITCGVAVNGGALQTRRLRHHNCRKQPLHLHAHVACSHVRQQRLLLSQHLLAYDHGRRRGHPRSRVPLHLAAIEKPHRSGAFP